MGWKPCHHRSRSISSPIIPPMSANHNPLSKWSLSLTLSILILSITITSVHSTGTLNQVDPSFAKDNGQSSSWQYAQQSASAAPSHHEKTYEGHGHYGHMGGTRQGALIGSPLYGVFPIIFLIGLAAIIIIPLLFFTFSPMGFAGGFGQSAYAKKRSLLEEWDAPSLKKTILDTIVTVSDAIEKYGGPFLAEHASVKPKKKVEK